MFRSFWSKTCKKPYLHQDGIDMVFPIFSPSIILLEMKNSSESMSLVINMVHGQAGWSEIFYIDITEMAKTSKNISVPGQCRYVFLIFSSFLNTSFLVQSFSDHLGHHVWPSNVKRRSLSGSQNFFLQKTISIPGECRYGFLIFSSLFNTSFLVQSFSDHLGHHVWPRNVKRRSLSGSQNFFLQKTISIPRRCRYGFFYFTGFF